MTGRLGKVGDFLLEEVELLLPPLIYFFCAFNLVVFTTDLLARHYWFALSHFLFASTMALIVGKVILVARRLPFINCFRTGPLIKPILDKTLLYSLLVMAVRMLEELGEFLFDGRGFRSAWRSAEQDFTWHRFVAVQVWLVVSFLIYVSVVELNTRLGGGELRRLLFGTADGARSEPVLR
jgi:hypothetical protein